MATDGAARSTRRIQACSARMDAHRRGATGERTRARTQRGRTAGVSRTRLSCRRATSGQWDLRGQAPRRLAPVAPRRGSLPTATPAPTPGKKRTCRGAPLPGRGVGGGRGCPAPAPGARGAEARPSARAPTVAVARGGGPANGRGQRGGVSRQPPLHGVTPRVVPVGGEVRERPRDTDGIAGQRWKPAGRDATRRCRPRGRPCAQSSGQRASLPAVAAPWLEVRPVPKAPPVGQPPIHCGGGRVPAAATCGRRVWKEGTEARREQDSGAFFRRAVAHTKLATGWRGRTASATDGPKTESQKIRKGRRRRVEKGRKKKETGEAGCGKKETRLPCASRREAIPSLPLGLDGGHPRSEQWVDERQADGERANDAPNGDANARHPPHAPRAGRPALRLAAARLGRPPSRGP